MARDKLFFIVTFAVLGLLGAFVFSERGAPPPKAANEKDGKKTEEAKPVASNQQILPHHKGKIAVPLLLTTRSSIVNFLSPGNVVDLVFTSKPDLGFGSISVILFKEVRVLGLGRDSEGKKFGDLTNFYKHNSPVEILIELSPKELEVYTYAEFSGTITLGIVESSATGHYPDHHKHKENDELVKKLFEADSETNFQSIIVTHMLQGLFPDADVNVTATPKGYIVSGTAPTPEVSKQISQTLDLLSIEQKNAVVNLIEDLSAVVEVLQATKNLKADETLDPSAYTWAKIKKPESENQYIVRSIQTEHIIEGAHIARSIRAGEYLSSKDLAIGQAEDKNKELSEALAGIEPGKRVIVLKIPTRSTIIPFLKNGLEVDVKFASKSEVGFNPVNVLLMKNIKVLFVQNEYTGESSELGATPFNPQQKFHEPNAFAEVFLEMSPKEAEIFSYAEATGLITLEKEALMTQRPVSFSSISSMRAIRCGISNRYSLHTC